MAWLRRFRRFRRRIKIGSVVVSTVLLMLTIAVWIRSHSVRDLVERKDGNRERLWISGMSHDRGDLIFFHCDVEAPREFAYPWPMWDYQNGGNRPYKIAPDELHYGWDRSYQRWSYGSTTAWTLIFPYWLLAFLF